MSIVNLGQSVGMMQKEMTPEIERVCKAGKNFTTEIGESLQPAVELLTDITGRIGRNLKWKLHVLIMNWRFSGKFC